MSELEGIGLEKFRMKPCTKIGDIETNPGADNTCSEEDIISASNILRRQKRSSAMKWCSCLEWEGMIDASIANRKMLKLLGVIMDEPGHDIPYNIHLCPHCGSDLEEV